MAHRKQNVFISSTRDSIKNGKSYVPAIDNKGNDSEGLVAFVGGFGTGNLVWDAAKQKQVYSFEVLDALPGTYMLDSDNVTQNDAVGMTGITLGTTVSIVGDSDNNQYKVTLAALDSDILTATNAGRTYIWSEEFGGNNNVIEGYVTGVPSIAANADESFIYVKPTSHINTWKAAMADGTISIIYDANNKKMARGKTINDDKNRYADADSDFMFDDDIA